MTGKHYNWHRRWVVDLAACTATHDSGLIVRFVRNDAECAWDGEPENMECWLAEHRQRMSGENLLKHAARLLREAGDAYAWQLKKRH